MTSKDLEYSAQVIQTALVFAFMLLFSSFLELDKLWSPSIFIVPKKVMGFNQHEEMNLHFWLNHPFKYDDNGLYYKAQSYWFHTSLKYKNPCC